jgi:mxaJ protein
MSFGFLRPLLFLLASATLVSAADLRVCADPDAMPSSNRQQQGYDNKIAALIARDLHANLVYNWQRNGRGFVRDILNKGVCDVVLGVPMGVRAMLTTAPYYRSTYLFVTRRDRALDLHTFQDPELKKLKIGIQVLNEEYAPPGQALGRHGLTTNIVGYDTTESPASIVNAVYRKQVDTAIVWGPLAGYFAKLHPGRYQLTPTPIADPPVPMAFSIAFGVSRNHPELRDQLNAALQRHRREIDRILRSYGVPLLPKDGAQ